MNAKRAGRVDHANEHRLRTLHVGPEAEAVRAVLARLGALRAGGHLDVMDPREIAGMVRGAGAAGMATGQPCSFETAAALAIAGLMAAVRAEELRVESGDEAA